MKIEGHPGPTCRRTPLPSRPGCLALKVWCEVENIELRWQQPVDGTPKEQCHYQRFLYRAERFRSLFPEWFHLVPERPEDARALGVGPFYLNTPGHRGDQVEETACDAEFTRESDLEKHLCKDKPFSQRFGLEKVGRQLPVGLFSGSAPVKECNRIFTGGKSAIDLVGIGDGALWLFELKAKGNIPAGILSELIFYASVMRDAIPGPSVPSHFQFQSDKPVPPMAVSATDVRGCKRIEAVLLAPQFHPLVGHPLVINILNEATARHWNTSRDQVPVAFSATHLAWKPGGYQFEPKLNTVQGLFCSADSPQGHTRDRR